MTCQMVSDLLPLLDDPELSVAERRAVQAHVTTCARCASELRAIRQVQADLKELRTVDLPAGGPERVLATTRTQSTSPLQRMLRRFASVGSLPVGGLLAGAAVMVLLIILPLWRGGPEMSSDEPLQKEVMSAPAENQTAPRMQSFAATTLRAVDVAYARLQAEDPEAVATRVLALQAEEAVPGSTAVYRNEDGSVHIVLSGVEADWVDGLLNTLATDGGVVVTRQSQGSSTAELGSDPSNPAEILLHIVPAALKR